MPSLGTSYLTGKRDLILDKKFYQDLRESTGLEIDDKTIRKIILSSNQEITDTIVNYEEGFKLPENLGYIVITKYKSSKKPIDWINTVKLKRKILLTNLHSFGYVHHIKWFKNGLTTFAFREIYKFVPVRLFKRAVSKQIKSGKLYDTWSTSDFWNRTGILRKLYNTD